MMKLPKLDLSTPKKACKPATVSRIWHASRRAISLHHAPAHQFALCQWQNTSRPTTGYVIYRWLLFLTLASVAVASFACQSLPKNYKGPPIEINYMKWFIYFTNWGFLCIVLQSGLALVVVHRYRAERNLSMPYVEQEEVSLNRPRSPLLCRLYWLSQSVATDLAFVITLIYWFLVHNPEMHQVNALNLLVHGSNSLVALAELCVTSHPVRLAHMLYGAGAGLTYGVFSAAYWAAGGTDRVGGPAIYPALDWNKPGSALGFVALCACVLCFSHCVATLVALLRTRLALRLAAAAPPAHRHASPHSPSIALQ